MRKILLVVLCFLCVSLALGTYIGLNHRVSPRLLSNKTGLIEFSGYTWIVSNTDIPESPGPNYFSSSPDNVWVDVWGHLHLKATYTDGKWHCAELTLPHDLGNGKYTFKVEGDMNTLDANVVAGLFIYQNDSQEYDIEFAHWGDMEAYPLEYTIQRTPLPALTIAYPMLHQPNESTHSIERYHSSVTFTSDQEQYPTFWEQTVPHRNTITDGKVTINLWLYTGKPINTTSTKELVINQFSFTPSR